MFRLHKIHYGALLVYSKCSIHTGSLIAFEDHVPCRLDWIAKRLSFRKSAKRLYMNPSVWSEEMIFLMVMTVVCFKFTL